MMGFSTLRLVYQDDPSLTKDIFTFIKNLDFD